MFMHDAGIMDDHESTTSSAVDEQVCETSLSDREAVVNIDSDAFHGLDDVPDRYESLVTGPGVNGYILKKGDRVVGFVSVQLVDGGQTLATTGGRIAPDCRSGGMYGRFRRCQKW